MIKERQTITRKRSDFSKLKTRRPPLVTHTSPLGTAIRPMIMPQTRAKLTRVITRINARLQR